MLKQTQKLPISVFIIAQDEEDRIPISIKSVKDWVSEVIVVDSGSSDKTVELSHSLGAKVIEKNWPGYGPQKRFAEEQCRNKWVLNLDADEAVSTELAIEIQSLFKNKTPLQEQAFKLRIESVYPVELKPGLYPFTYKPVRLYHLDQGRYSNSPIHDRVVMTEDTLYSTLTGSVHHRAVRSLSHLVDKTNKYTDLQAQHFFDSGRRISPFRLLFEFPLSFLIAYFGQKHFLRGWYGLILAHHYAYNRFMRIAKMWEIQVMEKRKATKNSQL